MGFIECVVIGERGIYYGPVIPNPDPTKPPIDMRRLFEKGELVNIAEEHFIDFEKVNAGRNMSKGYEIEVSYLPTGKKAIPTNIPGVDLEALKAQIKSEMAAEIRAQLKAEMEAQALRPHTPVAALAGKGK